MRSSGLKHRALTGIAHTTSRENSLKLIELSSINKGSLVLVSFNNNMYTNGRLPLLELQEEQFRSLVEQY
jgi:hypothetical protein